MRGDCLSKCLSSALTLGLLLGVSGCGRTHTDASPAPADASEAGAGALEPETELEPYLSCPGAYQSLPVRTPPQALPTVFEAELCNARDSRATAIEVAAGTAVSITLENPLSVDRFRLSVYRSDVDSYELLPVAAGTTSAELGRLAERSLTFTPTSAGSVSLLASLGNSRGEPTRLRIEQ